MQRLLRRSGWAVALGAFVLASACGERAKLDAPARRSGGSSTAGGAGGSASAGTGSGADASTAGSASGGDGGSDNGGSGNGGSSSGANGGDEEAMGGQGSISALPGAGGEGGSGGANEAEATGGTSATTLLTDFRVEPNPNMTISCFVTWTTNVPASSEVDFGEGEYAFAIRDDARVVEHRVLVIGMHAETAYRLRAVSTSESGTGSVEGNFTTGALPAGIPDAALTASDFTQADAGWTLTNVEAGRTTPAKIVMYDEHGLPVWYFIQGTHDDSRGDIATALVGDHVLVGPALGEPAREVDLSGAIIWSGPPQATKELQTHEFDKTAAGNYLFNVELDKAVEDETTHIDDQLLEELSPDLDVVWSWKLFDHVPVVGTREELCHGNALTVDANANVAYYNCRFLGLFKIDRASGDIVWRLGGTFDDYNLGPGDFTYDPPESQFSDAHDPEVHDDGTVLLYDNGGYPPSSSKSYHTRVVEYRLDEATHTATRTFEFPGDFPVDSWYRTDWYTPIWGDANRLKNGNILVTAGMRSSSTPTRIFEITRKGEVVWELTFPPNYGSYRATRLAPPPLVEAL